MYYIVRLFITKDIFHVNVHVHVYIVCAVYIATVPFAKPDLDNPDVKEDPAHGATSKRKRVLASRRCQILRQETFRSSLKMKDIPSIKQQLSVRILVHMYMPTVLIYITLHSHRTSL